MHQTLVNFFFVLCVSRLTLAWDPLSASVELQWKYNGFFDDSINLCGANASSPACANALASTVSVFCSQAEFQGWSSPPLIAPITDVSALLPLYQELVTLLFVGFSRHQVANPQLVAFDQTLLKGKVNLTAALTQVANQYTIPLNTSSPVALVTTQSWYQNTFVVHTITHKVCISRLLSSLVTQYQSGPGIPLANVISSATSTNRYNDEL